MRVREHEANLDTIVEGAASVVEYLSPIEGTRGGPLSFKRRRRALGAVERARIAFGRFRADGDYVCAQQSTADLSDCGCEGGRAVPLRRWRRELAARF